jgi:pimeloyl-ACP methyl ester carboxylesterase
VFEVELRVEGEGRGGVPVTVLGARPTGLQDARGLVLSSIEILEHSAEEFWPPSGLGDGEVGRGAPSAHLLRRVVDDAKATDVLGQRLSREGGLVGCPPSPLARAFGEDFEFFREAVGSLDGQVELEAEAEAKAEADAARTDAEAEGDGEAAQRLQQEALVASARFAVGDELVSGTRDISLEVAGEVQGAIVFALDSMIVPFPAGTEQVSIAYRPDAGFQTEEFDEAWRWVAKRVSRRARPILICRAYVGENTWIVDDVAERGRRGWYRLKFAAQTPGVLVARIALVANRRLRKGMRDVTAVPRRVLYEWFDADSARHCRNIRDVSGSRTDVVVAVHGTMASAIPMAAALRNRSPTWFELVKKKNSLFLADWPMFRFEHDTWQPIAKNAKQLARRLDELNVERAVLVGHSRGGLVVRHATELARTRNPKLEIECVTFGAPFKGTPVVGATSAALLGVRALLGVVRLATGMIAVDVVTRLAGFLIFGGPPRGIAAMDVDSDYLSGFEHRPPVGTTAIAGEVDSVGSNAYAIGFRQRVAAFAFSEANDLVVASDSAAGGLEPPHTHVVKCDHFSYLDQSHDKVFEAIDEAVTATLRPTQLAIGEGGLPVPPRIRPSIR